MEIFIEICTDVDTTINLPHWCSQAETYIEIMICNSNDTELWSLDHKNEALYEKVKTPQIKQEQKQWLKNVRDQCLTVSCIKKAYKQRILELIKLGE